MFKSRRLKKIVSIIFTCILFSGFMQTAGAAKTFKCWTNKEGIRECGNVVPPEYAQKGHVKMNEEGRVVEKVKRALTEEELKEQARQREIEAEEKRQAEIQARYDHALLSTYGSTNDMKMARDGKLQTVDAGIKMANDKIASLNKAMAELRKQAAGYERTGKTLPKVLREDMDLTQGKIDRQKSLITDKEQEKENIRQQFDNDIARYQKLKGL